MDADLLQLQILDPMSHPFSVQQQVVKTLGIPFPRIQPWLLNNAGSKDIAIRNTVYFVLPFDKNQCVKLKFPDRNFEDYDVIPWALIPEGALWIWVY